ncbi:hypothetical protein D3C86_1378930 [compost metagenome]
MPSKAITASTARLRAVAYMVFSIPNAVKPERTALIIRTNITAINIRLAALGPAPMSPTARLVQIIRKVVPMHIAAASLNARSVLLRFSNT